MAEEIELLEKALEAAPENWQVRRSLAAKMFEQGRTEEAGNTMLGAPEIPMNDKDVFFAAELIALSDVETAHTVLDHYLEDNAASGQGHLLQGRLYLTEGNREKAESHLKVAEVLDPSISMEEELAAEAGAAAEVVEENLTAAVEAVVEESDVAELTGAVAISAADVDVEAETVPVAEPIPVEEEADSSPVIPKPLAPPGSEPVAPAEATTAAAAAIAPPSPAGMALGDDMEYADGEEGEFHEEEFGDRSFIVGDGEMVHAHEKDPDSKEKISALTMAIVVHAIILGLLALIVIAVPRANPPMITASVGLPGEDSSLQNQTVARKQRTASAVTSAQPVVNVDAFSPVALPDVPEVSDSLTMVSMSNGDSGFGMSMSGFGDVSNMGGIPASMRSRCSMSERMKRLRESGGEDRCEKAVRDGLTWLTAQQNEDGSFGHKYKCAMTGFVLLAYLGHCETPESPKFGGAVVGAAQYLMERAHKNDGFMFEESKAYTHGIATYALCELHTMTKESGRPVPRLESTVKKAVKHVIEGQCEGGGWAYRYALSDPGMDMSVSGWQMQALKAAYNTGEAIRGLEGALDNAMEYCANVQDQDGYFKYRPDHPTGKPTLTGAALLGLQVWDRMDTPEYDKGMGALDTSYGKNPSPGSNFYAPYYNTQVFFLEEGKEWENYNKAFQPKLLDAQNPDGSWTKPGGAGHGGEDSQIMNTALGCLMLEVYYRYLPTTDKIDGLKPRR